MTQPPQWGAPPPPRPPYPTQYQQPGYSQQAPGYPQPGPPTYQQQPPPMAGPPGWLPPKPSQLVILAVLNWVLAVGLLGIAAFVIVSFLMSGATLVIGILLAVVVGGFGLLNALAALSINHPHFPNTTASVMAGFCTAFVLIVALFRSVGRGVAEIVPSLGSAAMLGACLLSLFLATRPQVKQWIVAKQQQSLAQGHRPRR